MADPTEFVEGWTSDLDYQLLTTKGNTSSAVNLTTIQSLGLVVQDKHGAVITLAGTVAAFDAANGKVRYTPVAGDYDPSSGQLLASRSPFRARWKVTDAAAKVTFFPNGDDDIWIVRVP